jgi:hypothetical protein
MDGIKAAQAKYDSDTRESFTREQAKELADAYGALAYQMVGDYEATN